MMFIPMNVERDKLLIGVFTQIFDWEMYFLN